MSEEVTERMEAIRTAIDTGRKVPKAETISRYVAWIEAKHVAALHAKETALNAKETALNAKEIEHRDALSAKEAALSAKEAALHAKELGHRDALSAKELEHRDALHAKELEHLAALNAKEMEHNRALSAKDEMIQSLQRQLMEAQSQSQPEQPSPLAGKGFSTPQPAKTAAEPRASTIRPFHFMATEASPALSNKSNDTDVSASRQRTCLQNHEIEDLNTFGPAENTIARDLKEFATDEARGEGLQSKCVERIENSVHSHLVISSESAGRTFLDLCFSCFEFDSPDFLAASIHDIEFKEEMQISGREDDFSTARLDYIWTFNDHERPVSCVILEAKVKDCMIAHKSAKEWAKIRIEFQQLRASMSTASAHFGAEKDVMVLGGLIGFPSVQPKGASVASIIDKLVLYPALMRSSEGRLYLQEPYKGVQALLAVQFMLMMSFKNGVPGEKSAGPGSSTQGMQPGGPSEQPTGVKEATCDGDPFGIRMRSILLHIQNMPPSPNVNDVRPRASVWSDPFGIRNMPPSPNVNDVRPRASIRGDLFGIRNMPPSPNAVRERDAGRTDHEPNADLLDYKMHRYTMSMQPPSMDDLVATIMTEDGA